MSVQLESHRHKFGYPGVDFLSSNVLYVYFNQSQTLFNVVKLSSFMLPFIFYFIKKLRGKFVINLMYMGITCKGITMSYLYMKLTKFIRTVYILILL